jgi:hypothetical protein
MKAILGVALHHPITIASQPSDLPAQTEDDMFRARALELDRQKPGRLARWFKALIPATLATRIAERRAARELASNIKRLESLAGHLLEDIGVEKVGPAEYIVRTDDMDAVRASRQAEALHNPRRLAEASHRVSASAT